MTPSKQVKDAIQYTIDNDTVVYSAPTISELVGRQSFLLRGWKQFQSCIKGFNALGLISEHVVSWLDEFTNSPLEVRNRFKSEFLEAKSLSFENSDQTDWPDLVDLAIWHCFANRPIVCSTSSNMGISLHEILRMFQDTVGKFGQNEYTVLSETEGELVIWCPDERADFMNSEKAFLLRKIEAELPKLTRLRTYINRQQRDPGALRDAIAEGGYFFPTNPQSAQELQNLLYGAIVEEGIDAKIAIREVLSMRNAVQTLTSLGCQLNREEGLIEVRKGVEGGIFGLMIPYWLLIEELLELHDPVNLDVWNQASIGAALAAAVQAELVLRNLGQLDSITKSEFCDLFPRISSRFFGNEFLDKSRRIVGVFDIANLQSLAQLLGVTVPNHTAGRSTAFVGLGSSSYSNGNRCFEILDRSSQEDGPFQGRQDFVPATHTLSPVSQALVVGEDLRRIVSSYEFNESQLSSCLSLIRKPEPAGAAALAAVLLRMLDQGLLTVFELSYSLRFLGYNSSRFLALQGLEPTSDSEQQFIQLAFEEGPFMGQLAADLLSLLNWPIEPLRSHANRQRNVRSERRLLDELSQSTLIVYLTGDNCQQPSSELLHQILTSSYYPRF
jgi:hypothetical protein